MSTASLKNKRVCVTGGAGFIGSHLCDALVEHGANVVVLDDLSHGREQNIAHLLDRVQLVRGSILDTDTLKEATEGAQIIFHHAALTSVPRSVLEPEEYHEVNATGTLRVLEAARQQGGCRVIYAASSSAYGDQADDEAKVETMCAQPLSPYAATKYAGEQLLRVYALCYGLSCVSLRYFNIFGPRQRADSPYAAVVPIFADAMKRGRKPMIFGDGMQTRDFTHVANAVHANILAATTSNALRGDVVNIACGTSYSLLELVQRIAALLSVPAEYELAEPRVGEVKHSRANIDAARRLLGYEPVMGVEDGLADVVGGTK